MLSKIIKIFLLLLVIFLIAFSINEVSGSKFSFNGVGTQIIKMSELFILWVLWVIKIFLFVLFLKLFCISFIFFLFVSYPIIE